MIKVTNLKAAGPGSFQAAVSAPGKRIIIFEVGGIIELPFLDIKGLQPWVTIAGQTAANWGGITLHYGGIEGLRKGNGGHAVLRHLRIRGVAGGTSKKSDVARGFDLGDYYPSAGEKVAGIIYDHLSSTGACDQDINAYADSVSVQWCFPVESCLQGQGNCDHPEGNHNYGSLFQGHQYGGFSIHHTLFSNHFKRVPLTRGDLDFRNNVIYNSCYAIIGPWKSPTALINNVGNYYKDGDAFESSRCSRKISGYYYGHISETEVFFSDNASEGRSMVRESDPERVDNCSGGGVPFTGSAWCFYWADKPTFVNTPAPFPPVTTYPVADAFDSVLSKGGAWPRDNTDLRVVNNVRTGGGPWEGCFFETDDLKVPDQILPTPFNERIDSDGGGIPDKWETANGLNKNDAADDISTSLHGEYMNIEVWFNQLAEIIVPPNQLTPIANLPRKSPLGFKNGFKILPNPVLGQTNSPIQFQFEGPIRKREIQLHNVSGKLIQTLKVDGKQIKWDGKDRMGNSISAGLYLIRVINLENQIIKRAKLIKLN